MSYMMTGGNKPSVKTEIKKYCTEINYNDAAQQDRDDRGK